MYERKLNMRKNLAPINFEFNNTTPECKKIKKMCKMLDLHPENGSYKKCYKFLSSNKSANKYYQHPDKGGDLEGFKILSNCIGRETDYGKKSVVEGNYDNELAYEPIDPELIKEQKEDFVKVMRERVPDITNELLEKLFFAKKGKKYYKRNSYDVVQF